MAPEPGALGAFIAGHDTLAVLSGAGVSTASGIPDYRDRKGEWKQAQPIQFGDFVNSEAARRRYWSRSFSGWGRFASAAPNAAHVALARLEAGGKIDTLVTQNVDRLHSRAGSRRVIDLHGDLGRVRCLDCGAIESRDAFQARLAAANAGWRADVVQFRPDGDAELPADAHADFRVPECDACGGVVKPDVVMFGEAVPKARVAAASAAVERADALLVVGSSLMVFSGFRFARQAQAAGKPVAIINRGRTRGDELATLKVDADCAAALTAALPAIEARA